MATAIDFNTPSTAYGETQWGDPTFEGPRRSDNVGVSSFVLKTNGIDLSESAQFIPPLVMSPSDSTRLYFGTCRVYRTTDKAETWTPISPVCGTWSGTLTAIAEAPLSSQVIYAGTSTGGVRVTTDGGTNWTLITSGLPVRFVKAVAVHPSLASTAFVTFSGFGTGHVFKTTNTGVSWTNISGNLPDVPVNAILLDPGDPTTTIYIGTDLGVFKTSNGGATWVPFNTGLPNVAVFDLAFRSGAGVLVAATHGRSAFTLSGSPPGPSLSINDVTANEGNSGTTPFNFTVTLFPVSSQTVTLNFATADGTATTASGDYVAAFGNLTFNPGETTKTITVLVNGDTQNE